MSNIEEFPAAARELSEYEALVAAGPGVFDAIPGAVYLCDHEGWLVRYNGEAAELWGRTPEIGTMSERFCGSYRMFLPDGTPLAHAECPMATAIRSGEVTRNAEVVIERPDPSRVTVLVNIRPLWDTNGRIEGAINCFQDISGLKAMENEIRRKNEDLDDFFDNSAIGLHIVNSEGIIQRANKAELALLGYTAEEYVGRHIAEFHADAPVIGDILHKLSCGEKLDRLPARLRAKDGSIKHVLITSNSRFKDGKFVNTRCFTTDVTNLHEAERARRDLLEALPAAVYTTDAEGRINFYNKAAVEMSGRVPQPGDKWCVTWHLYHPDGTPMPHEECPMAIALREGRPVRGAEAIAERPDGTRIPFIPYPTPLFDSEGNLVGAINMLVDITERKQAENRQKVLIDELNHRVKNTLATVQSLAAQTARHAHDLADFSRRFEDRMLALSRAHDLLTRRHWEDAPLNLLAGEVLMALTGGDAAGRITMEGPEVELSPRAALSLTMALNELTTNAIKYGSLSSDAGKVSLVWGLKAEPEATMLCLEWCEEDGPPVTPPSRRGVGTRLMELCVERDLGGEFDLAYDPDGLVCTISVPLDWQHG